MSIPNAGPDTPYVTTVPTSYIGPSVSVAGVLWVWNGVSYEPTKVRIPWVAKLRTNPLGTSASFPRFDAAWNGFVSDTSDVAIGFIGASTTQGINGGSFPNTNAYPRRFRDTLCAELGVFPAQFMLPGSTSPNNQNGQWSYSSNWALSSLGTAFMSALQYSSGGALTPAIWNDPDSDIDWDTATVWFLQNNNQVTGDTFSVSATGGGSTTGQSYFAGGRRYNSVTVTASKPSRENSITITPLNSSANVYILGVTVKNSRNKSVLFANCGVGGSSTTNWNSSTSGADGTIYGDELVKKLGCSLVFVSLGINEYTSNVSDYIARIQALVSRVATYADVVLLSPNRVKDTPGNAPVNAALAQFEAAILQQVSGASSIIPMYTMMGTVNIPYWSSSDVLNWHPTAAGYKMVADLLYDYTVRS